MGHRGDVVGGRAAGLAVGGCRTRRIASEVARSGLAAANPEIASGDGRLRNGRRACWIFSVAERGGCAACANGSEASAGDA